MQNSNQKIFIFSNPSENKLIEYRKRITCENITCSVCNYDDVIPNEYQDTMTYDVKSPISNSTLSTPCCQSILCPYCFKIDKSNKIITTSILFIESVIFLQHSEELNLKEFDDNPIESTQYQWGLYKPIDKNLLNNYKRVIKNYNSFSMDEINRCQNNCDSDGDNDCDTDADSSNNSNSNNINSNDLSNNNNHNNHNNHLLNSYDDFLNTNNYYCDLIAICKCTTCGFECTANNYMDS